MTALAAVVVTAIYAFFTIRLWQATKEQATITRSTFEASHRPYVTLKVYHELAFCMSRSPGLPIFMPEAQSPPGRLSFHLVLEDHGSVPATITAWEVHCTLINSNGHEQPVDRRDTPTPVGVCLAPRSCEFLPIDIGGGDLLNPVLPFQLEGSVEYHGVGSSIYRTKFDAERAGALWVRQGNRLE
jgi:hypothetical protein